MDVTILSALYLPRRKWTKNEAQWGEPGKTQRWCSPEAVLGVGEERKWLGILFVKSAARRTLETGSVNLPLFRSFTPWPHQ